MNMKHAILIVCITIMSLSFIPANTYAASSGDCGDFLRWELNGTSLSIKGSGAMNNYSWYSSPFVEDKGDESRCIAGSLMMYEGATSIGDCAFAGGHGLMSAILSNSVTKIGEDAFCGCDTLYYVSMPSKLKYIEDGAFMETNLGDITIPGSVYSVGESAFQECTRLKTVVIENGVKSIEHYCFIDCDRLDSVTIPKSVTSIGAVAFGYGQPTFKVVKGSYAESWLKENEYTKITYISSPTLASATLSTSSYIYDGKAKEPEVTVKGSDGKTLIRNVDYTVSYSNNVNVGTATVRIEGKGDYTGTLTLRFEIKKQTYAISSISLTTTSFTYDGKEKTPSVTVKGPNDKILTETRDYTVKYSNNVNVGTATVTVTGRGDYYGTLTANYKIKQAEIGTAANVELSQTAFLYSGLKYTPTVYVHRTDGNALTEYVDYTVACSDNTEIGTATVTVSGKGNYTGKLFKQFEILNPGTSILASAEITPSSSTYTGSPITPAVSVVGSDSKPLTKGTDYTISYINNTKVGTALVKITGTGTYKGSLTKPFLITGIPLRSIILETGAYVYDGTEKKPSVTVKGEDGKTLTLDVDYTVSYSDNVDVGQATVMVYGKGNYSGTLSATFTILGIELYSITIYPSSFYYDGIEKCPEVTVKDFDGNSVDPANYTVSYANNINAGTATVTVIGHGNYQGKLEKTFVIEPAYISGVILSRTVYEYSGEECRPSVTVTDSSGNVLEETTDYLVTYYDTINPGEGTVQVDGVGNYTGTIKRNFTINKLPQQMTVTVQSQTVKAKKVKKKAQAVYPVTVTDAQGDVKYRRISGSKKLKINSSTGKVTVKKKTKKGVYKMKVKVTAMGTDIYAASDKTVTVKIRVR